MFYAFCNFKSLCALLLSITEWYLYGLTEATLADAAKPGQLEAVCSHQQVLRHGTVQITPLQLLHTHMDTRPKSSLASTNHIDVSMWDLHNSAQQQGMQISASFLNVYILGSIALLDKKLL